MSIRVQNSAALRGGGGGGVTMQQVLDGLAALGLEVSQDLVHIPSAELLVGGHSEFTPGRASFYGDIDLTLDTGVDPPLAGACGFDPNTGHWYGGNGVAWLQLDN